MDLDILAQDPSPTVRGELAAKIATNLNSGGFSDTEKHIAHEILNLLASDIELDVRRTLSHALRECRLVSHELISKLVHDVAEVAVPVLQYSYVLSEDDLIEIVRSTREVIKLSAIARRETISHGLSDALLETDEQKVLHTLFHNRGAHIADEAILNRWDRLTANPSLLEALVQRGGLSVTVAEKLFSVVSDEMKHNLAQQYRLPIALVEENVEDIREWATLGMLMPAQETEHDEKEIEALVSQLYAGGRLTYSLIIRSLCTGDLPFFETSMACLAGVPRANARILMFDSGQLGFRAFYEKAHMPEGFYEAIRVLLRISLELTQYGRVKREDFRRRVIERIHHEGYDRSVENMNYLLSVLGGQLGSAETLH